LTWHPPQQHEAFKLFPAFSASPSASPPFLRLYPRRSIAATAAEKSRPFQIINPKQVSAAVSRVAVYPSVDHSSPSIG
jgi:hypothetical protein